MAVLPRCIEILTRLFKDVPENIYSINDMATNVTSSLNSINNLFIKFANDSNANVNDFIFRNNIDSFINKKDILSNSAIADRCNNLIQLTENLRFSDETDNDISRKVCAYLHEYIYNFDTVGFRFRRTPNSYPKKIINKLADRKDCPIIVFYLFCQILFAHFYRKKYCIDLTIQYPDRLLFNDELNKFHFSLPYEDQVTCSYFVFRYIYLPEEREKQYTDKNKYDCGFKTSKPTKYKFTEVDKILSQLTQSESLGKKTTSFDNFTKKALDFHLLRNTNNKSKNYNLLKFYLLVRKIKTRRDVVRSVKSNDKYGFDILKMLSSIDIENYIFDGLPYKTSNGYHCTLLQSELKKDIDFVDLITLTKYYYKTNYYIRHTLDIFDDIVNDYKDKSLDDIYMKCHSIINSFFDNILNYIKNESSEIQFSENVMLQALSLVYIQSIEACLLSMYSVYNFLFANLNVIDPDSTFGIFSDEQSVKGIEFSEISSSYPALCKIIQRYWPELLPPEEIRVKKFISYFETITGIINESKTSSYNQGSCSNRFLVSMILVCLLADKGAFKPIPKQSFYHSGQESNAQTVQDLLKSKRYSIFKHFLIPTLFEAVNNNLSGKIDYIELSISFIGHYYKDILEKLIPMQKTNPKEGLKQLYEITQFASNFFTEVKSTPKAFE